MALNPTGSTTAPGLPVDQRTTGGGNYNFGNTQNPNPPPSSSTWNPYNFYPTVGTVTTNPTGTGTTGSGPAGTGVGSVTTGTSQPATSANPFGLSPGSATQTLEELRNQFGDGMGTLIYQYLQSSGGYNSAIAQQDVSATNAALQKNIQLGEGNLQTNLAESGISPNSSSSALEISNYLSNAYTQMNQIDASIYYDMWNSSQNRELSLLEDTGKVTSTAIANQPGFFGQLEGFLGLGKSAAGGASSLISAFDPNADTSVLDALAGF